MVEIYEGGALSIVELQVIQDFCGDSTDVVVRILE